MTSYDALPYDTAPHYPTHPDNLAALAALYGLTPAPVDRCRVLELGCADGGNLLPMAEALPDSRFVGIDLSPVQIAAGQEVIAAVGLPNVELRALSILDVGDDLGPFDYILCHGVYSWVPPAVQEKILAICRRHLAPHGLAYVSYNTYPGWHGRQSVREAIGFHARRFADPADQVREARAFLNFLLGAVPDRASPYYVALQAEAGSLQAAADAYVYHEHLESENHPVYFHEFMARAGTHGLQYVDEAWNRTSPASLAPAAGGTVRTLTDDRLQREQYLDFVLNRTFRRSVLCHADVPIRSAPDPAALRPLSITTLALPLSGDGRFQVEDGRAVTMTDPVMRAVLTELSQDWPAAVPAEAAWQRVQRHVGALDFDRSAGAVLPCYQSHLVLLHTHPPRLARDPSDRPRTTALARYRAERGLRHVPNLRHQWVELADFPRAVLALLDGCRDVDGIAAALGGTVTPADVAATLHSLGRHALLVG